MSMNMNGNPTEFTVKVGSRSTLRLTFKSSSGVAKDLTNTVTFSTGKWKVWKPDGTLIINGDITYVTRSAGLISYTLSASDTVLDNAGVWEGEIELDDSAGVISDQTKSFTFIIEESY